MVFYSILFKYIDSGQQDHQSMDVSGDQTAKLDHGLSENVMVRFLTLDFALSFLIILIYCFHIQKLIRAEQESMAEGTQKRPRVELQSLPTRQYLDQTVVPILLVGLNELAKTRCAKRFYLYSYLEVFYIYFICNY